MNRLREIITKWIRWKPDTRLVAAFAVVALALLFLPLVRVAFYAVPWYDDYNYGSFAKAFYEQDTSLKSVLEGVLYCVKTQWYAWQGTFSSIFFMSLMPAIWGEDKYFLGAFFLMALFLTAILVLVKVLVRNVFGGDKASCVLLQAATAIFLILLLHRSQLAFYWYNAGVHYVGMHSFFLLLTACGIRLMQVKHPAAKVALVLTSMVLALLVGGSNYVTSLQSGLVLLTIAFVTFCVYHKNWKKVLLLLPSLAVYGASFYMNVTAPGNDKRAAQYVGWGLEPVEAVLQSFVEAVKHMGEFTGWMTLAILLLIVPVIWQMVQKTDFTFRYPVVVLIWSFCLYATGFTSSLYSLGHGGLTRTLNAARITFQLLLVLNEIYWLGWLQGYLRKKQKRIFTGKVYWWFYPLVGVFMLFIFWQEPNKVVTYSAWGAYEAVHSGEAYNFYQQYQERVEALKGPDQVVELEPYRYKPFVICAGDLSENPEAEENRAIANWYGKEAVICREKE